MNKRYHINHSTRIAQLADQAHEESNLAYYQELKTKKADQVIFYDIFNQRLAELIIQECTSLFEVEWGEEKLTGNDVGYVVKKHFGIT